MKKCTERCIFFCFSREFFYIMLYRPLAAEAILDDRPWLLARCGERMDSII